MKVKVNDTWRDVPDSYQRGTLLEYLREFLDLTGAKNGCGIGRCGTCTVLVDDRPRLSCRTPVEKVEGKSVTTIEGMESDDGSLHPLQKSFVAHGAVQCGFCTPAMVLRAHGMLSAQPNISRKEIRKGISGNLCRCTGYQQIVDAIEAASSAYPISEKEN